MTPRETAERIVLDHLKKLGGSGGLIPKYSNMGVAKQFAEYTIMKIVEELRIHVQDSYNGQERLEYWKEVKRQVKHAFSDS
jgi:hypothetical protein